MAAWNTSGRTSPRVECSGPALYKSIHPVATHSTSSMVRSGPLRNGEPSRIASFLNSPIVDSARALSYASPIDPIDPIDATMSASASVSANETLVN